MKKIKLVCVVGTRPEIIRLSRILYNANIFFDLILIHTGQNFDYELSDIFFNDLSVPKPKYYLKCASNGTSPARVIGEIISKVDSILEKENPDAFMILGDTNSCLSAISAKKRKIPIFHLEAGNRCFDMRVPEEINRKIVDHISDINLSYSKISREYLIREGIDPDKIIKVGSPMREVLNYNYSKILKSQILKKLKLKKFSYFLISCHRQENVDEPNKLNELVNTLSTLVNKFKKPIIFPMHPRTKTRIKTLGIDLNKDIIIVKPLNFTDYVKLQINSMCVMSDSGTISEEASILNFPAINIRENHERPEAMEEAAVIMTGFNSNNILQAINILKKQKRRDFKTLNLTEDYSQTNISEKVIRIILSYTDYINRETWKK